jgi:hypothetical protein
MVLRLKRIERDKAEYKVIDIDNRILSWNEDKKEFSIDLDLIDKEKLKEIKEVVLNKRVFAICNPTTDKYARVVTLNGLNPDPNKWQIYVLEDKDDNIARSWPFKISYKKGNSQ